MFKHTLACRSSISFLKCLTRNGHELMRKTLSIITTMKLYLHTRYHYIMRARDEPMTSSGYTLWNHYNTIRLYGSRNGLDSLEYCKDSIPLTIYEILWRESLVGWKCAREHDSHCPLQTLWALPSPDTPHSSDCAHTPDAGRCTAEAPLGTVHWCSWCVLSRHMR